MKIGITLQLEVVGAEVKDDGSMVLVVMFEGVRKELKINGLEQNADWTLNYGQRRDDRNTGIERDLEGS